MARVTLSHRVIQGEQCEELLRLRLGIRILEAGVQIPACPRGGVAMPTGDPRRPSALLWHPRPSPPALAAPRGGRPPLHAHHSAVAKALVKR